jgi:hypothetical protein
MEDDLLVPTMSLMEITDVGSLKQELRESLMNEDDDENDEYDSVTAAASTVAVSPSANFYGIPLASLFVEKLCCDNVEDCVATVVDVLIPYSFDLKPGDELYSQMIEFLRRVCEIILSKLDANAAVNMSLVNEVCKELGFPIGVR